MLFPFHAMVHPDVPRGGLEQGGIRKVSRIWPRAVRVAADISLTTVFLPFCGGFPSQLAPAAPSTAGDERGDGSWWGQTRWEMQLLLGGQGLG